MPNIENPNSEIKLFERSFISLDGKRRIFNPQTGLREATPLNAALQDRPRLRLDGWRDE